MQKTPDDWDTTIDTPDRIKAHQRMCDVIAGVSAVLLILCTIALVWWMASQVIK